MANVAAVENSHVLLLIDQPRGREAVDWYINVFGAIEILPSTWGRTGAPSRPLIAASYLLRLGPADHYTYLYIWETIRPPTTRDRGNCMVLIYCQQPLALRNLAVAFGGVDEGEQRFQDTNYIHIRDPFGFSWILGSMNLQS